ncbi:MAG: nitroreductase family protein [Desulfurococcus sp.]|uniref:nitroreductase family protein n=1 Tax=Desulfurococcus sp. TaxID=51678 RepID=UPI003163FBB8
MTCPLFDAVAKVVRERRSIREYMDEQPPKEVIEEILDLARWSPSGNNVQDWRFTVVRDKNMLEAIKAFSPGWIASGNPVATIISSDREWALKKGGRHIAEYLYYVHAGIVAQTISLLAHAKGLGTCMIASFSREAVKTLLSLPENWEPVLIMLVGYPRNAPQPPPRLPLDELVTWR